MTYPCSSHSWMLPVPDIAIKTVDKSLLLGKETGVPQSIVHFFPEASDLAIGQNKNIRCISEGNNTNIRIRNSGKRIRLYNLPVPNSLTIGDEMVFRYFDKCLHIIFLSASDSDLEVPQTQKLSEINIRVGQQVFRERVINVCQGQCVVTGINFKPILVASHIKSWKDSSNNERLDGQNGLLLAPHVDKLFDKHLISFDEKGSILKSKRTPSDLLRKLSIDTQNSYCFTTQQFEYLKAHREIYHDKNSV